MFEVRLQTIVIVGPTASGKSALAVRLAKKFNGEVISADSRQVYRGLNIGTGKVPGKWISQNVATNQRSYGSCNIFVYKKIPHYCIDFVPPKKIFTVAEYKKCAEQAISDISGRGKIPILVGGTGFWIDAVVYDLDLPAVAPNQKLRKRLGKKSAAELLKILKRLDPERAQTIEQKNPRRLIRAIEIAKELGRVPAIKKYASYQVLWIGWRPSESVLRKKIHARLLKRLKAGMIEEARRLRARGLSWKRFYELGLEYKFLADYLRGKITKKELVSGLEAAINGYARRQETWFKRNPEIHWINTKKQAEVLIKKFLKPLKNQG